MSHPGVPLYMHTRWNPLLLALEDDKSHRGAPPNPHALAPGDRKTARLGIAAPLGARNRRRGLTSLCFGAAHPPNSSSPLDYGRWMCCNASRTAAQHTVRTNRVADFRLPVAATSVWLHCRFMLSCWITGFSSDFFYTWLTVLFDSVGGREGRCGIGTILIRAPRR
jgi:hypothetical protein